MPTRLIIGQLGFRNPLDLPRQLAKQQADADEKQKGKQKITRDCFLIFWRAVAHHSAP
jgi:hypothetical protein